MKKVYISSRGLRDLDIGIEGVEHLLYLHGGEINSSAETALENALEGLKEFRDELEWDEYREAYIEVEE